MRINAQGDHLVLTPNWNTAASGFTYTMEYKDNSTAAILVACNHTNLPVDDAVTFFNLLVIDAQ